MDRVFNPRAQPMLARVIRIMLTCRKNSRSHRQVAAFVPLAGAPRDWSDARIACLRPRRRYLPGTIEAWNLPAPITTHGCVDHGHRHYPRLGPARPIARACYPHILWVGR